MAASWLTKGIGGDDLHLEPQRPLRHDAPDVAQPNDAQGFSGDFHADQPFLFPLSLAEGGGGLGDVPGQGKHHGQGMLGRRHRISAGGVHHHDPFFRGGLLIDVVHADPGPPDDLEPAGTFKHALGHPGAASNSEAVEFSDDPGEGLGVRGRLVVVHHHLDLSGRFQNFFCNRGHVVPDHDSVHLLLLLMNVNAIVKDKIVFLYFSQTEHICNICFVGD